MQIGTYEASLRDRARERHKRLFPTKKVNKTVAATKAPEPIRWIPPKPSWKKVDTYFDNHVIESRRILEMIKSGDIDIARNNHRTIVMIVSEVLKDFPGVTPAMVKGYSRRRDIVEARHSCIYAVREERQDLSYPSIGRWFNRDHSSVLASYYKMAGRHGNVELQAKHDRKMERQLKYHRDAKCAISC